MNGQNLNDIMVDLLKKYKIHFPEIKSLYDYQGKTIYSILEKKNTLSIIPTGGGKSLIFQLTALEFEGLTIVISPLLALMREQVQYLIEKNITAISLTGDISFDEQRLLLRNLKNSQAKLLYLSPERLQNPLFRASLLASGIKISMIVIDEAHCISQWGLNFRPDYGQIKPFINFLQQNGQNSFVYALTATLSEKARLDIINEFNIVKSNIIISDKIIRDNLNLSFQKVTEETEKVNALESFINTHNSQKALIYLYSRRKTEEYSTIFNNKGYASSFFHADMEPEQKGDIYNRFKNGEIRLLFATTAFGMGINIPDIDAVVHLQLPESIEEYYQHAGRGARLVTKCPVCNCLLLWSDTNVKRKRDQILKMKYSVDDLNKGFKLLGLFNSQNKIVSKDKEDYLNSTSNLPLLRYLFESKGLLETIGEINGSPLKIELDNNTPLWNQVISVLGVIDSFVHASNKTKIPLVEIIEHLYEQEYKGNIKKLPAKSRQLFFKSNYNELPEDTATQIMMEYNIFIDDKEKQFNEFTSIFLLPDQSNIRQHISNNLK